MSVSNFKSLDHWSVTLPDTRGGQGGGSALAGGVGSSTFYQNNGRECDCVSNDHFLCTKESCSMGIADPPLRNQPDRKISAFCYDFKKRIEPLGSQL